MTPMAERTIYILLTRSGTWFSRLIHFATRDDYTHASIGLDGPNGPFYSFARKYARFALPAGLVIWLCANVQVGGDSILNWCTGFLDPFARLLGLDGVILMAFLLGFPANEIVLPIVIMAYLSTGSIVEYENLTALKALLVDHGWTWLTAVCTMLFSLAHWPCSTTCLTIARETRSVKWTALSIALPTGVGMALCFLTASAARLLGLT